MDAFGLHGRFCFYFIAAHVRCSRSRDIGKHQRCFGNPKLIHGREARSLHPSFHAPVLLYLAFDADAVDQPAEKPGPSPVFQSIE